MAIYADEECPQSSIVPAAILRLVLMACDKLLSNFESVNLQLRLLFHEEKMISVRKHSEFWVKITQKLTQFLDKAEQMNLHQTVLKGYLEKMMLPRRERIDGIRSILADIGLFDEFIRKCEF